MCILAQRLVRTLRRGRHVLNVYYAFCYFLTSFSQQPWCTCPITLMWKLKLRKVEKLTQSHTVKGRQGPDSHPGVSDSSPGVPLGPQLESLVLRTNVSPPSSLSLVLSPSFLLF